jgi:hypothetical protein
MKDSTHARGADAQFRQEATLAGEGDDDVPDAELLQISMNIERQFAERQLEHLLDEGAEAAKRMRTETALPQESSVVCVPRKVLEDLRDALDRVGRDLAGVSHATGQENGALIAPGAVENLVWARRTIGDLLERE